jgi:outer membrane protein OmpA-like peptidoglycan-associated protein
VSAKADADVAKYGGTQLDQAEAALDDLRKNLEEDDATDSESLVRQIDALVETAKIRAEIADLKASQKASASAEANAKVESAEARATAAEAAAEAARQRVADLQAQLHDFQMKQTAEGAMLVMQDVIFETDSANLRPGAVAKMRPLADYLNQSTNVRVRITGHADSRGSDAYNMQLSENRANSVKAALVSAGVDPGRIEAVGMGESQPVATNSTAAGRQANRRVEVTLLGQTMTALNN